MSEKNRESVNRILAVDDSPADLDFLTRVLRQAGYTVHCALDAQIALWALDAKLPDLILLDAHMPLIDGYEFCGRLKENERTRDIPVIFISAGDRAQDKVKA